MQPRESISYQTTAVLPGFEVLDARNTAREWRWFNMAFAMAVPDTWKGEVVHRRRRESVGPGGVFCATPGELHTTPRIHEMGSFRSLLIAPDVFRQYLEEFGANASRIEWNAVTHRASHQFLATHRSISRIVGGLETDSAMALQTAVLDLFRAIAMELVKPRPSRPISNVASRAAERMRELLHSKEGIHCDLDTLARVSGVTRFQALRAFKQRYGLPPHAYQTCVRIERARELLKSGQRPAEVSANCGFADQSHFGRHFKAIVGTTPGHYMAAIRNRRDPVATADGRVHLVIHDNVLERRDR